jgi:hypothetical protein
MTEIKELFKQRDDAYTEQTHAIIKAIDNVTSGASQFIQHRENATPEPRWEDVSFMDDDDGYIILVGVLEYAIGDTMRLPNGAEVEVNEQTAEYFKRLLRVGVPYKLACEGTDKQVFEFLVKSAKEAETAGEEIEQMVQLPVSDVDDQPFDLDDLTEEQKEQLRLFALANGELN